MVSNVKLTLLRLCLLIFLTGMSTFHAYAHNGQDHLAAGEDVSLNAALHWLELSQSADGAIVNSQDIATNFQATAEALSVFTLLDSSVANQATALTLLQNSPQVMTTEGLVRLIIALSDNTQPFAAQQAELLARQNNDGGFGEFEGYDSTTLDTSLALLVLQKVGADTAIAGNALAFLSSTQKIDGSFAVYGDQASVIVTAMVLRTIRSYLYTYNISDMLSRSIEFLYTSKNASGGWGSYWETALVLQALIPVTTDVSRYQGALDYLKNAQSVDGDWNQRVYTTALATAALKLSSSVEVPADPEKAVVTGRLTDTNGLPITGAVIDALGISTEIIDIQADGSFIVSNLEPGAYIIAYSAPGYLGASQNITLQKGQFVNVGSIKLSIAPTAALISGVIKDASSNTPISGAVVSAVVSSQLSTTTTDVNGTYQLLAEAGAASIEVSAETYRSVTVSADLVAGTQVQFSPSLLLLTEELPTTSALHGIVVDEQGQFISGATVVITGVATTTTSTTGVFEFSGLSSGEIEITISKSNYQSVTFKVVVPERSNANVGNITLREQQTLPSTTVSGRVIDMVTGNGVAAASVVIGGSSTTTDTNGFYRITGVSVLEFTVSVNASGYLFANKQVLLAEHSALNLDINIRQADLGSVTVAAVTTNQASYGAYGAVIISTTVKNDTALNQGARFYVKVKDSVGVEVASFPGAFLPPLDPQSSLEEIEHYQNHLAGTIEQFTPGEERTIQLEQWWNTLTVKPGTYTVTVQALDSITSNLVSERSTLVSVDETRSISLDVKVSPGYVLLNGSSDIEILADVLNLSNTPINVTFDYRLLDPLNQVLTQGNTQFNLTAEQRNKQLSLSVFPYTFNSSGYYRLEVSNVTGADIGELSEGAVFVPPSIRLRTTQSLQPNEVVPLEGVPVNSNIQVEGVDGE